MSFGNEVRSEANRLESAIRNQNVAEAGRIMVEALRKIADALDSLESKIDHAA